MAFFSILFLLLLSFASFAIRITAFSSNGKVLTSHFPLQMNKLPQQPSGKLIEFLKQMKTVGSCRLVVQGKGAILETIGRFENLRFSEISTGTLATLSTDTPAFELHLRLREIETINLLEVQKFDKNLRIARFLDSENNNLLSVIIAENEAIQEWKDIVSYFGNQFAAETKYNPDV